MMRTGIDVGYGFVKGVAGNGLRCCFPSAIIAARNDGDLADAVGGRAPRHRVEIQRPSGATESWWAGNAALMAGGKRTWDMDASQRHGYDVLLLTALGLLGIHGPVAVGVGLPMAVFARKRERRLLRERLSGLAAWVSVDGQPATHVEVTDIRVLPQGVAAYYAVLLGPEGRRLGGRPVGVIDVGYRTTDYLLLEPQEDGAVVPDETRSGSVEAGIGQVYDATRKDLSSRLGLLVPGEIVERALSNDGILYVHGQEHDVLPVFKAAAKEVAARVEAEIRRIWADRLDFLAAVLIAGGGGEALAEHVTLPAATVVPEAVYGNAVGFLRLIERMGA